MSQDAAPTCRYGFALISFIPHSYVALCALSWGLGAPTTGLPVGAVSLSSLSDQQLELRLEEDTKSLGSLSIGYPHNGRLLNGVTPSDGELFEVVAPDFAYGTKETLLALETAVRSVHREHADTPPLHLGHISKPAGGYLSPHLSHQSGRDVDLGFYYKDKRAWYRRGTSLTLDLPRTWSLIRALITETDVEFIFVDYSIQALLKAYAISKGEDKSWLHKVFTGSGERPAIIRHARGHATHLHVRFYNPVAQANAQRAYPLLLEHELIEPVLVYAQHRVRKGETLGMIARRYGTTVRAIQQANGLRSTLIQAKRVYKIPRRGGPAPVRGPLEFPPRVVPESG